jgi:hypothetical protein
MLLRRSLEHFEAGFWVDRICAICAARDLAAVKAMTECLFGDQLRGNLDGGLTHSHHRFSFNAVTDIATDTTTFLWGHFIRLEGRLRLCIMFVKVLWRRERCAFKIASRVLY